MKSTYIAIALASLALGCPVKAQGAGTVEAQGAGTVGAQGAGTVGAQGAGTVGAQGAGTVGAQGAGTVGAQEQAQKATGAEKVDMITPHITDSRRMELPSLNAAHGFAREIELPTGWPVFHIGSFAVDTSPTKLVVMLWIVATILVVMLVGAARSHTRRAAQGLPPKGMAGAIEAIILYMRNEVILPNVGHHGEGFVPYLLTIFFFILIANLLGLIPYMSTATGNISVTATLAIMTFVVIEVAGMKALGAGYINTIIFWPKDMPLAMRVPMSLILSPVELISKITKPFALAIRLFANMTAGHIVVLAIIGLIFTFGSYAVAPAPVAMAVAIMLLELMVAVIQAFIFVLLSSVFIGLVRESSH
jgi:F-type H+-transporting ATPase subunit a